MKARVNANKAADGKTDASDFGCVIGEVVEIFGFVIHTGVLCAVVGDEVRGFGEVFAWMLDPLVEVPA